MAQAKKNLQIRLSDDVRELLSELCHRERTTPTRLIERLIHERAANPLEFYAHCAAFQTNAIYYLLGQLVMNIARDPDQASATLSQSVFYAREIFGPMPAPPEHLANRDAVDPRVAKLYDIYFG